MAIYTRIIPLNMAIFHSYVNVYQRVVDEITPRLSCQVVCQALAKTNIKQAEEQRISYPDGYFRDTTENDTEKLSFGIQTWRAGKWTMDISDFPS